ncbi:YitT family protein [Eisenibacter elegans]|jgi:uncharacterized membrane-anchored protein YitT (DUF2179 family)|uniref:YitT family protein n=1 Tax=Eisenibacter elegans TaxID=997 RepID=UPI001FDFE7A0|nr:YitT family protein [Eisenibacter elegans]
MSTPKKATTVAPETSTTIPAVAPTTATPTDTSAEKAVKNEKRLRRMAVRRTIKSTIFIILGIFSAGLGLEGFLLPNKFIDGGVTGISLLVASVTNIKLPFLIFAINVPFIIIGYRQMSPMFALRTTLAIAGLSLVLTFVHFPVMTHDKLLVAVFGGFFLGTGIGFAVRGGSVIDGTEVLAVYVTRKTGLSIGDIILLINICIFAVAAVMLDLETAFYSILTYMAASRMVDFFVQGIEEYIGVTIISNRSDDIRHAIIQKLSRGVTLYKGQSGYNRRDITIVYTIVTRLEISKLLSEVEKIDEQAFVIQTRVSDTKGGVIKKRPLH